MYISGNYKKVKDEIENRRLSAVATAELHNMEVREKSSEIRAIDEELTRTGLAIFRTACYGGDLAPIRARNTELCEKLGLTPKGMKELGTQFSGCCFE